ncbi:MAG TPA: efflux RND transporter periplasmic adaptor subunit [Polyangiales bacterium]|nr:efflux RND transporter periplasmic adaptor subunit [Polyangiales bacterium]
MKRLAILLVLCACDGRHAEHDHDEHAADPKQSEHAEHDRERPGVVRVEPGMLRDLRITVREAELRSAGEAIAALGELVVNEERYAEVGSPIAARVARVLVAAGDKVSAGQPLVELDSPELGRARAELTSARARKELAERALARRTELAAERIVAQRELDSTQAEASEASAQLSAAEQSLAALGGGRGSGTRFVLNAPITGSVIERNAVQGRLVDAQQRLFAVGDLSQLWLVAHAFERDALRIQAGRNVRASFPALPGREFAGSVLRVGSRVDPLSRTLDIRIAIDNPEGVLRPGMSATARIPVGDESAQIVALPVAALQRLPEGWCVFLPLAEEGSFETRPVGRGRDLGGEVEVVHGLKAGERVVVDGAFLLKAEVEKARGSGADHHHH